MGGLDSGSRFECHGWMRTYDFFFVPLYIVLWSYLSLWFSVSIVVLAFLGALFGRLLLGFAVAGIVGRFHHDYHFFLGVTGAGIVGRCHHNYHFDFLEIGLVMR